MEKARFFVTDFGMKQYIKNNYRDNIQPLVRRLDMMEEEIVRLNKLLKLNVPASNLAGRIWAIHQKHSDWSNPQIAREAGCSAQEVWRAVNRKKKNQMQTTLTRAENHSHREPKTSL